MYHQFIQYKQSSQKILNQKLHQVLEYYEHLKSKQFNDQLNGSLLSLIQEQKLQVGIDRSLSNEKHNCMLFWLTNDKLVRYDFADEVFEQIYGLYDMDLMSLEVLEIGQAERYLLVGETGLVILSIQREKKLEEQKKQAHQNVVPQNQQQKMQEESNSQLINQKPCSEYQFNINRIKCKTCFQSYRQGQFQNESQRTKNARLQSAKVLIVKDSGPLIQGKFSSEDKEEKQINKIHDNNQSVFLLVTFIKLGIRFLVVYELTIRFKNDSSPLLNKSPKQFSSFMQSSGNQTLQISQMQFSNNKHFIQIALSHIEIPFNEQKQSQDINPIEVTQSNSKFTHSNLLIDSDRYFVKQQYQIAMFSFYCVTQAITHHMGPGENRSYVFEFRLGFNLRQYKAVLNEAWGSPIYSYPQRQVMCPAKVYCLPLTPATAILCYINVTKKFYPTYSKNFNWQPRSYKFTTVTMHQNSRMQFSQIEHRISESQQEILKQNYRNTFNEEDRIWNVRLDQNLIFSKMILIDLAKRYVIMLVRQGKVQLRSELVPRNICVVQGKDKAKEFKIVVLNLSEGIASSHSRVACQLSLEGLHEDFQPQIHLDMGSMENINSFTSQEILIQTQLTVLNNSLMRNKSLSLLYHQISGDSEGKIKNLVFQRIEMVPKATIYCSMLQNFMSKIHQENKKGVINIKEETQTKTGKYNGKQSTSRMDAFFATVIDLLGP